MTGLTEQLTAKFLVKPLAERLGHWGALAQCEMMETADTLQKTIGDLSSRMQSEYRRLLLRIWPLKEGGVGELKTASLRATKELEENARRFIADATGQVSTSLRTPKNFALVDDALASHISALEESVVEKWQLNAMGLASSDELRTEFERVRARLNTRLQLSRPELTAGTNPSPAKETRGRKPKHDWVSAAIDVWDEIAQGQFKPELQSDVEKALVEALSVNGAVLDESNVRDAARKIWRKYNGLSEGEN